MVRKCFINTHKLRADTKVRKKMLHIVKKIIFSQVSFHSNFLQSIAFEQDLSSVFNELRLDLGSTILAPRSKTIDRPIDIKLRMSETSFATMTSGVINCILLL